MVFRLMRSRLETDLAIDIKRTVTVANAVNRKAEQRLTPRQLDIRDNLSKETPHREI